MSLWLATHPMIPNPPGLPGVPIDAPTEEQARLVAEETLSLFSLFAGVKGGLSAESIQVVAWSPTEAEFPSWARGGQLPVLGFLS